MKRTVKIIERLQYITQASEEYSFTEQIRLVTAGGGKWIQFRMKNTTTQIFNDQAEKALHLARERGATFIVNDDVRVAKQLQADGVHLGKEDMDPLIAREILGDDKIIGCTANTIEDIHYLRTLPIDYIGLGPFRFTGTKKKLSPIIGQEGYVEIMQQLAGLSMDIPIIAIGGILVQDIATLCSCGIHGVAVSGGIIHSIDPSNTCRLLLNEITKNTHEPITKNS